MITCAGNIHIHSRYSDGSGSIDDIAGAAAQAGLQYVVITDHRTLQGLTEEGFRHGVLVLVGCELNRDKNHYLAMRVDRSVGVHDDDPQKTIDAVRNQGGFGFLAHPFEKGSPLVEGGKAYPWTDWSVTGFTGLEIWNYCSEWRGRAVSALTAMYWFFFNRAAPVGRPPAEALQAWDACSSQRRTVGIGGTDAHAALISRRFPYIKIFPYRFLFRTINTYLQLRRPLSGCYKEAKAQVYSALQDGRCYVSFDLLHGGRGFAYSALLPDREAYMGEEVGFVPGISLRIKSPARRSLLRIMKNGKLVCLTRQQNLVFKVLEKGIYRVEVYYRSLWGPPRPWIYSNPIYIR